MIAPTIMANHASLNSASNITLQAKQELGTNNTTIHAGKRLRQLSLTIQHQKTQMVRPASPTQPLQPKGR